MCLVKILTQKNISESEKGIFSEYIRLNGQSLAKIIDDIIDIAKIEAGQLKIIKTECNVNQILTDVYQSFY